MATIGDKPILWHIMKYFSAQGFHDFIICGGYKVNVIKEYFMDFYIYQSDITVDLKSNQVIIHKKKTEDWNVTVVDTGLNTAPGIRVLQTKEFIDEENFIVVHGDCLSNIDINQLADIHKKSGKTATITVARPTGRNEVLPIAANGIMMTNSVAELPENQAWVNACCEIFTADIFNYLVKSADLGSALFQMLANEKKIVTYQHHGFWSPVETRRDYVLLQNMWNCNEAPWKIW